MLQPYSPTTVRKNSVVVLDNASIHHSDEFADLIMSTGAIPVYSAPLCPHLNPIELGFGEMKKYLKRALMPLGVFPVLSLYQAMEMSVTETDARKFYVHCGYKVETVEMRTKREEEELLLCIICFICVLVLIARKHNLRSIRESIEYLLKCR